MQCSMAACVTQARQRPVTAREPAINADFFADRDDVGAYTTLAGRRHADDEAQVMLLE